MSEKKYSCVQCTDCFADVLVCAGEPDDADYHTITATPRQIYEALQAVGREVVVENGVIKVDGSGFCSNHCILSRGISSVVVPACKHGYQKMGKPTDKCPGAGTYDVVLRKREVCDDEYQTV